MPNRWPISSGNWSNPAIWSGSLIPTASDDVFANNFTINMNTSFEVLSLRSTPSGSVVTAGGTFNFNTGDISGSITGTSPIINSGNAVNTLITASSGTITLIFSPDAVIMPGGSLMTYGGNCNLIITSSRFVCVGGNNTTGAHCISKSSTGTITMIGDLVGATQGTAPGVNAVLNTTNGNSIVIGSITGAIAASSVGGNPVINQTAGNLTIVGNVTGGNTATVANNGINFSGTTLTITGSVTGGSGATNPAAGINITSTPTINISGSVNGASAVGIQAATAATINITGSVAGAAAAGISLTGASVLNVNGTVTGGSGAVGISSTSTSATNRLTGPFITGPTGIQPFYGPKLTIITGSATYWTFTSPNLTTNKTLYSTDLVSGVPSPSNVRQGVTYASGALTGTMIVPATSSVAFGVPVDTFTGSAIIVGSNYNISNEIWNTPVTSLTGSSTIGERLKNNATVASTGAQIAAMAGL